MTKQNPSNPFSRDPNQTKKDVPMPFKKAKVIDVKGRDENGFHVARVRVYGDRAPYDAPVLSPMEGCVWVPEKDSDVIVLFTDEDKPVVIGQWYAVDRVEEGDVDLPPYEPGDIRLGNSTGSHVTVENDGSIEIQTTGYEPVDIDVHASAAYLSSPQLIQADTFTKVEVDATDFDRTELFDATQNALVIKEDGVYDMRGKVRIEDPGQSNIVTVQVRRNGGSVLSQNTDHTTINVPIGIETTGYRELEAGDVIELYVENANKDATVEPDFTELSVARQGV